MSVLRIITIGRSFNVPLIFTTSLALQQLRILPVRFNSLYFHAKCWLQEVKFSLTKILASDWNPNFSLSNFPYKVNSFCRTTLWFFLLTKWTVFAFCFFPFTLRFLQKKNSHDIVQIHLTSLKNKTSCIELQIFQLQAIIKEVQEKLVKGVLRAQLNIQDGAFLLKAVNYFRKKSSSQMYDWVLNAPLLIKIVLQNDC